MNFDWRKFLDRHHVEYVTKGPNTAHNHVSIQCPWCGSEDPSQHLGISLDAKRPVWGCLRNSQHRGSDPVRLVRALLGCGEAYARNLVTAQSPGLDDYDSALESLSAGRKEVIVDDRDWWDARVLKEPVCFSAFDSPRPNTSGKYVAMFTSYLINRGFENPMYLAHKFKLRYCLSGAFKYRVIIPFFYFGRLVGWTGRSISPTAEQRYLTLPSDTEAAARMKMEPALTDPGSYVMSQDLVEAGGGTLLVVEGPLDWLKMRWYKTNEPVTVTCLFGMPKQSQVWLLAGCARGFSRCVVMLDREAHTEALTLAAQMHELSGGETIEVLSPMEFGAADPGALSKEQVKELLSYLTAVQKRR